LFHPFLKAEESQPMPSACSRARRRLKLAAGASPQAIKAQIAGVANQTAKK